MIIPMPQVNRHAFEQAAWPHRSSLHRLALSLTRRPDAAEDLVQDTFVRAFKAFHTFEPGTNLRAWLSRILRHAFITRYRAERARRAEVSLSSLEGVADLTGRDRDPESIAMGRALPSEIHAALAELPGAFRDAITYAFIDELSYQEIAERMGVPIGTVMSRIHRGRRILRERLHEFASARRLVATGIGERRQVA